MTRLLLVRHGETEWNRERRFQGRLDPPLNANGRRQAVALAGALQSLPIAAVCSSPLARAYETAELVAERHGLRPARDPDWSEIDHGQWNGLLWPEVRERFGPVLEEWLSAPDRAQMPGGETLARVRERSVRAFDAVTATEAGRTVVVVSHDAVIRTVLLHVLGMPLSSFWHLKQGNTCINVIERQGGARPRLTLLNDLCHLGGVLDSTVQGAL